MDAAEDGPTSNEYATAGDVEADKEVGDWNWIEEIDAAVVADPDNPVGKGGVGEKDTLDDNGNGCSMEATT